MSEEEAVRPSTTWLVRIRQWSTRVAELATEPNIIMATGSSCYYSVQTNTLVIPSHFLVLGLILGVAWTTGRYSVERRAAVQVRERLDRREMALMECVEQVRLGQQRVRQTELKVASLEAELCSRLFAWRRPRESAEALYIHIWGAGVSRWWLDCRRNMPCGWTPRRLCRS